MEQMISFVSSTALDTKMDRLKNKSEDLDSRKKDIKEELKNVESSSSLKPRNTVKRWLEKAENICNKVQRLDQDVRQSSWLSRPRLKMDVDNHTREVTELIKEGRFPNGLTIEAYEQGGVPFLTTELVGETFERNKKMIWDCLIHGDDPIISIYGMGGVGKTTLLTHIHNELLSHGANVYWVTVSSNCSIRKLQHDIARKVKVDISDEDDERIRAAKLARAFKRRENFILILDDVWEPISLDEVGICVRANGCKLVLTTRSIEVCRKTNCQKPILVQPLNRREAWTLFMKTLGNEALLSDEIEEIAESLVGKCAGLPLGVATLAGSMKGVDDIHEWRNALKELEEAKGEMDGVFSILKHSYDKLKDPLLQECFLYCSLFPEDMLIKRDDLIEYFIDEKFFDGINGRQPKINKGHKILNQLVNVCLLIDKNWAGIKFLKMHDLIRDMAIKIASSGFLVQTGMIPIRNEIKWSEDVVRVSFMENDMLEEIPCNESPPRCPSLLTLLLCRSYRLKVIPDDFFMHMKMLSVLDLSYTSIESLPTSISYLESLTALLLRGCQGLTNVPSLENLTALRQLDLSDKLSIAEVPEGMEKLINLRYLDLDGCWEQDGQIIRDGILSELSQIEYFSSRSLKLCVAEIANWRQIETFVGRFDHIDDLNMCLKSWEEREDNINYTIFVGYDYFFNDYESDKFLKQIHLLNIETEFILAATCIQYLSLVGCDGVTNLSHIAKLSKALRGCCIDSCKMIRHVICSCCCNLLHQLEILRLVKLPLLTDLIESERSLSSSSSLLQINSFFSLKELLIDECSGLKRLFTSFQLSHLRSLERLSVSYCKELVEIIGETSDQDEEADHEETTTQIISFPPKLRYLNLRNLPELKSLCSCSIKISNSLEEVHVVNCWNLIRITLLWEESNPPDSLKTIRVLSSLAWKHPQTKAVLQPFVKYWD